MKVKRFFQSLYYPLRDFWYNRICPVAYPYTSTLHFPVRGYLVSGDGFGKYCIFDGVVWGYHMGEDCNVPAGTKVMSAGRGKVVYAAFHFGSPAYASEENEPIPVRRNWGGIVIVAHKHPGTRQVFYSLYGHLGKIFVKKGDCVDEKVLGEVGGENTPENGLWEAHLHFALYIGQWKKRVLPGYWKGDGDPITEPCQWLIPSEFVKRYRSEGDGKEFDWIGSYGVPSSCQRKRQSKR